VRVAVDATRAGAFDFLEKPLTKERILVAVANALRFRKLGREWRVLKERETKRHARIGSSPALERTRAEIEQAGPSSARILILGESGTGKELIARAVHEASERRTGPFVKLNCAAIPEELIESELFGAVKGAYTGADRSRDGKFLQADGGTLFLDEIGDMSHKAQAKVLRALQEGEIERVGGSDTIRVDVRVIAATNKDLAAEVAAGRFREDLFFRLNVVPIHAAPLRERTGDVALLARHFLERFRLENNRPPMTFSSDALAALAVARWPGNVRELENAVERLAIMTRDATIGLEDLVRAGLDRGAGASAALTERADMGTSDPATRDASASTRSGGIRPLAPEEIASLGGLVEVRRRFEAACIEACLRESQGNVSAAARLLGIDRTNLHKKIQAYGLDPDRVAG
jgi:two-component system nitrogen regulation response regulator NtrX